MFVRPSRALSRPSWSCLEVSLGLSRSFLGCILCSLGALLRPLGSSLASCVGLGAVFESPGAVWGGGLGCTGAIVEAIGPFEFHLRWRRAPKRARRTVGPGAVCRGRLPGGDPCHTAEQTALSRRGVCAPVGPADRGAALSRLVDVLPSAQLTGVPPCQTAAQMAWRPCPSGSH